jgi:Icc-related predicted phosphoesterase
MTERYDKPPRCENAPEYISQAVDGHARKIVLAGDTHGDSDHVGVLLEKAKDIEADAIFILGDFGIWDHHDKGAFTDEVSRLANCYEIPVCFLPGNHDNYDLLFEWEATKPRTSDGFFEIRPGLFYSPRGHRWTWGGVRFLSLGGAYSVDKYWRVQQDNTALMLAERRTVDGLVLRDSDRYILENSGQYRWWRQEEISEQEMRDAMVGGPVDVMLAHDKPRNSRPDWNRKDLEECWPNQERLQAVVDAVLPRLYLHGHLHYAYSDLLEHATLGHQTVVRALDCNPESSDASGGSGETDRSWVALEIADDCFSLEWTDAEGEKHHRDFELDRMETTP